MKSGALSTTNNKVDHFHPKIQTKKNDHEFITCFFFKNHLLQFTNNKNLHLFGFVLKNRSLLKTGCAWEMSPLGEKLTRLQKSQRSATWWTWSSQGPIDRGWLVVFHHPNLKKMRKSNWKSSPFFGGVKIKNLMKPPPIVMYLPVN